MPDSDAAPWLAMVMADGTMVGDGGWHHGWRWEMVPWLAMGDGIMDGGW